MFEFLLLAILTVLALCLGLAALIALPLMLVGLLFKFVFIAVTLPFRLLGFVFGALLAVVGVVGKTFLVVAGALLALVLGAVAFLAVPLVPLLAVGFGIWLMVRLVRGRPAYAPAVPHRP